MTGVSIGWFDTSLIPDGLGQNIRRLLSRNAMARQHFRSSRRELRFQHQDVGVAYGLIGGHLPLHRMTAGIETVSTDVFHFVIDAVYRPALITAAVRPETSGIFQGFAPPTVQQQFMLGAFELKPGMAFHLSEDQQWQGVTAMPAIGDLPAEQGLPSAALLVVRGFQKEEIGAALMIGLDWVHRDMAASAL